ncbi:hypothetical protein BN7_6462 [Wickerhamomyces ciferrii]|uniref:Uncharacterized protein n=1 Tax=Wickerhamomyces ciferrii (strain ATCC 14091 / BCRC 22168 / CBS 111 / JCM 3599 / NBRC 0793 / NRRL Y-1031 F-60-10) TaxID=1206466 RepID=K0KNM4_WICCF|nr:uncharacterized protein BN7_6462 [Wickerhamomyces ciferrii]CCH46860.1 hypothetical protein BN7_6462 [Wickerhamomyces ciferrii]
MSMFKTLQNNPGVITFFNNSQSPISKSLLSKLQKSVKPYHVKKDPDGKQGIFDKFLNGHADSESKTPRAKYNIELVEAGFPTYDQLKIIRSFVKTHPSSKATFTQVFPKFIRESSPSSGGNGGNKFNANDIEIPDEQDTIELINKDFDELLQNDWFKPPLIIDWDNQLIANNESSLDRILKHYSAENHSNGD